MRAYRIPEATLEIKVALRSKIAVELNPRRLLRAVTWASKTREIGILLLNNQRQHRTLHIQKDVLPYAFC